MKKLGNWPVNEYGVTVCPICGYAINSHFTKKSGKTIKVFCPVAVNGKILHEEVYLT